MPTVTLDRPVTIPVELPVLPIEPEQPSPPSISDALATPDTFRDWLRQHTPNDLVGLPINSDRCPIASWAQIQMDDLSVSVSHIYLRYAHRTGMIDLPEWAQRFVHHIDNFGRETGYRPIRAGTALHILENIS